MPLPEKRDISNPFLKITPEDFEEKDYLTEVFLRSGFNFYLENLILKTEKEQSSFSVAFIDLDRFKKFNDKYGHLFGDEVLKYIGSSLRLTFQGIPCKIFRYGGDEFVVIFPGKSASEAKRLVQLLKHNMSHRPVLYKGKFFKLTASYGIASYPNDGMTADNLVKRADMAQYISKSGGRNLVTLASDIKTRRIYRVLLFSLKLLTCILLLAFLQPIVTRWTQETMRILAFQLVAWDKDKDRIVLTDGRIFQGQINQETFSSLTLMRETKEGRISMYFEKSQIEEKIYGKKTHSKERFDAYLKEHPNPHHE